jgi:6-phosphogluconolactonase (cycloisomerase 2 family)
MKQIILFIFLSVGLGLSNKSWAQAPKITSFTPTSGAVGATVTLTGTGFNTTPANNIVFFGATRATVTVATATSLIVTVPTGATFGAITVLNTGTSLAAYSTQFFNPTFSPNKSSITSDDIAAKVDFTTNYSPIEVAIGDLDGDGKPDLVVANRNSNNVAVHRNTSTSGLIAAGSFAKKVGFTTGNQPTSVAIGDLDGDGKPDLAVANNSSNSVSVYRNTSTSGSIVFATKVDFATGNAPSSVAIGDLDGDGKPDLAVANSSSNTVSVYRNTSTSGSIVAGSFAAKFDFTTGTQPISVAIGDLDGNGKPDLAVANFGSASVSVFRNTSTSGSIVAGSFAAKVDFATGTNPYSVAIGDLDGDGKPYSAAANFFENQ